MPRHASEEYAGLKAVVSIRNLFDPALISTSFELGSFGNAVGGWVGRSNVASLSSFIHPNASHGARAMFVKATATGGTVGIVTAGFHPATAGLPYSFGFHLITTLNVQCFVDWYNATGTYLTSNGVGLGAPTGGAARLNLSGVTAPAGATQFKLLIEVLSVPANGSYYIDAVQYEQAASATAYTAAGTATAVPGRLATETYVDALVGAALTGQGNRLATEDYVNRAAVDPPQAGAFVDNFTRADFPSLGGSWLGMASGEFGIVGSRAAPGVNTFCVSIRYLEETSGDHQASVRVGALGAVGGPVVRAPDTLGVDLGTTEGFYVLTVTGALSDVIAIRRHVPFAAGLEQLGALVTGTPVSVGDTLRLEAQGDTLRGYLNGALVLTRTDATVPDTNVKTGMFANQTIDLRFSRFDSAALTVAPPVVTAPGAPTGATASLPADAPGAVTVAWTAPASNGGSPILGYQVRVSPGGRLVDGGTILTRQIDGLTAGTSYTFTVAARNTLGYGPASAASNAAVPAAPPTDPVQPVGGTTVFRAGNWWERPLPANAPVHPDNRLFLQEFNSMHAVNGLFAGGPVNAQGDRYVALTGGADATATTFDTPIYRVSAGTSYILTKLSGAYGVPPEFLAGGAGLRIPEAAKQHFLLGGAQSSDAPMLIIDSNRGYYANLAKCYWNANLGRWEVQSGGAASIYYTSSYGHDSVAGGWPAGLTQYQDEPRNSGFRGNNPMTRVIDYDRMVAQGKIPYVTELFAVRTANTGYHVFPMVGHENTRGGIIGHGVRLRLKASLTDATIQSRLAATLTGNRLTQAVMIAKAWRDYGVVVGDNSGSGCRVKVENFSRRNVPNTWDVNSNDLMTFDFHPDTGDWVFIQDEYFPPVSGTADTTPPAVPAAPAVDETSTSATVSWVGVATATSYKVWRNDALMNTTASLSYVDTAVTAGVSYTYKVSALDAAGNESAKSGGAVGVIPAGTGDTTAPTVPTGLSASAVSGTQINLAWNASTDAVGVVSYRVRRAGTLIATVSGTSYQNTGLTASTSYSYTVAAVDAAGNQSAVSLSASATTQAASTGGAAPGIPPGVTAYMTSDTMVTVKFGASTGTTAAQSYKVYRSGAGGGAATVLAGSVAPVSNTGYNKIVTAIGLAPATLYSFAVASVSAAGAESAKSATQNATTAAAKGTPVGNVQVAYISGDIAIGGVYNPNCIATGNLVKNATDKNFVIICGDNAYSSGSVSNYNDVYHPAWGAFKAITYPCPGNHETPPGYTGYKSYFGSRVPQTFPSYYSYTKGNWLFLSLDSNDTQAGMATQVAWIQTTIAGRASTIKGICAYFHHARWTSTTDGYYLPPQALIDKLGAHNVDVVLQAHDHHYERFAKLNAAGQPSATGMRFFVVGAGGSGRRGLKDAGVANSEQIIGGDQRGVLRMAFGDSGYSWNWIGAQDAIYADGGTSTATEPNPSTGYDSGFNTVNPR